LAADHAGAAGYQRDIPAKCVCGRSSLCRRRNHPQHAGGATPDQVYAALLVADQYGQRSCRSGNNLRRKSPQSDFLFLPCRTRQRQPAFSVTAGQTIQIHHFRPCGNEVADELLVASLLA
jgi:hypothetical protein